MNKIIEKTIKKAPDFQDYLAQQLKNKKIKAIYDDYGKQLEIAYKIIELRKKAGISQAELAEKLGTKQNNIARIESGGQNLTTQTLQKIALAFRRDLKIDFIEG